MSTSWKNNQFLTFQRDSQTLVDSSIFWINLIHCGYTNPRDDPNIQDEHDLLRTLEDNIRLLQQENEDLRAYRNKNEVLNSSDLQDTIKKLSLIILNSVGLIQEQLSQLSEQEVKLVKYIWQGEQFDLIRNYNELITQMDQKMHDLLDLSLMRSNDFRRGCFKAKKIFEYLEKLGTLPKHQIEFAKYLNLGGSY